MDDCKWSTEGHLVGLPGNDELQHALARPADQDPKPWASNLEHFNRLRALIEGYVKCNKSYAIVFPNGSIRISRDQSMDIDFAKKALPDEKNIRVVDLETEDSPPLSVKDFAVWAADETIAGAEEKYKQVENVQDLYKLEDARNYAAEYLMRNGAWMPTLGPVIFAHPSHGMTQEEVAECEREEAEEKMCETQPKRRKGVSGDVASR